MKKYEEIRDHLLRRAEEDEDFRARFVADPKAVVEDECDIDLPESFEVKVHEDGNGVANFVLPPSPELKEEHMDRMSGGECGSCYVCICR